MKKSEMAIGGLIGAVAVVGVGYLLLKRLNWSGGARPGRTVNYPFVPLGGMLTNSSNEASGNLGAGSGWGGTFVMDWGSPSATAQGAGASGASAGSGSPSAGTASTAAPSPAVGVAGVSLAGDAAPGGYMYQGTVDAGYRPPASPTASTPIPGLGYVLPQGEQRTAYKVFTLDTSGLATAARPQRERIQF